MTEAHPIRRATLDDAAATAAIKNAWIDASAWLPRLQSPEEVQTHHRQKMIPERDVYVIGAPVVGYIALDAKNFVTSLFCSLQGHGMGKALLDHAKRVRPELWLWSFVENARACAFYERERFVETRRAEKESDEGLPDILYHWKPA